MTYHSYCGFVSHRSPSIYERVGGSVYPSAASIVYGLVQLAVKQAGRLLPSQTRSGGGMQGGRSGRGQYVLPSRSVARRAGA
jgi:hypothetical protein